MQAVRVLRGSRCAVRCFHDLARGWGATPKARVISQHGKVKQESSSIDASTARDESAPTQRIQPKVLSKSKIKTLAERLFPLPESPVQAREIPKAAVQPVPIYEPALVATSPEASHKYPTFNATHGLAPILRLEGASKNLTLRDFQRIIPQGKHIEGWTLVQGDIIGVIPGRELDTLKAKDWYFLIFASPESAEAYYHHARLIHELAKQWTPNDRSLISTILPPGIKAVGTDMDVKTVVEAYTLVSPDSRLYLKQLNYPLSMWTQLFVRDGGLPWLARRPNKDPFELRLTLDGPDIPAQSLSNIFHKSGAERLCGWSGGSGYDVNVTKWEPSKYRTGGTSTTTDDAHQAGEDTDHAVYIIGFESEQAARSFRAYWHRRPIGKGYGPGREHAPLANLEMLW